MPVDMLEIAKTGLMAYQGALATTGHNVSNVNTPGYTRQRAELVTPTPQATGSGFFGRGVDVATVSRSYDDFLTRQMRTTTSGSTYWQNYTRYADQIDGVLANPASGLMPMMDRFFGSLHDWSADPANMGLRETVLAGAGDLTQRFHDLDHYLNGVETNAHRDVEMETQEINRLLGEIADLNKTIETETAKAGQPPNDLLDRRDERLRELSQHVEIQTTRDRKGNINVFLTAKGQALVVGNAHATLSAERKEHGIEVHWHFGKDESDITNFIHGGSLGGILGFLDEVLAPTQKDLNKMAVRLARRINRAERGSVDLENDRAKRVFDVGNRKNAAGTIEVNIEKPEDLGASEHRFRPGDNRAVSDMAKVEKKKIMPNRQTLSQFYQARVAAVGESTRGAKTEGDAQGALLQQVSSSRSAVSGVNLDEEGANLVRFTQAYQAVTQIVSTADTTFQELLNAVRR